MLQAMSKEQIFKKYKHHDASCLVIVNMTSDRNLAEAKKLAMFSGTNGTRSEKIV